MLFCLHIVNAIHLLSVYAVWIRSPRPLQLPVFFLVIFLTNDTWSSVSPHRHCLLHWLCTLTPCASANCTHAPFGRYSGSIFPSQATIHGLLGSVTLLITAAIIASFRAVQPTECKELDCKHMHPSLSGDFSSMMRNHAADGRTYCKHNYSQGGPSCFICQQQ